MIKYITDLWQQHGNILPVVVRLNGAPRALEGTLAALDEYGIIFVGKDNKDDVSALPWTSIMSLHPRV